MAAGFSLNLYPFVYKARFDGQGWHRELEEKPHRSPEEESGLSPGDRGAMVALRNSFPDLPLINYTTQYGMGCFEGLKAYPQKNGSLKVFRPDANADRFYNSMAGLMMPPFPKDQFVAGVLETVRANASIGFRPSYDPTWEKNDFITADSVYLRPFSYSEGGIGLNLSSFPWVIIAATPVGSYFDPDASSKALVTDMIRANSRGTGWIKCAANYVIPTLAKKRAMAQGYMEAVFLDAATGKYIEEGSSCNFFALLKSGVLVTPAVEDRILNGINRQSIIVLARELGVTVEERGLSLEEVMSEGVECFVTGTAAGVSFLDSLTVGETTGNQSGMASNGDRPRTKVFNNGKMGELTRTLLVTLKGIQYGSVADTHGWMVDIE
jgi:branched-chain amino acid aminotransferase